MTKDEMRLAARQREKAQFFQGKFDAQLQREEIDRAITTATEVAQLEEQLSQASLERLLEVIVRRGTQAHFARALGPCSRMGLKVDVNFFVRLLTVMVQRGCPTVMFRIALNMPLPPEAPVVPLLPPELDDQEEENLFEDGAPLQDEKAAPATEAPAEPVVKKPQAPQEVVLRGCRARPELNGTYTFTDAYRDFLEHSFPTYRKGEGECYAYFWKDDVSETSCWCLAAEVGASEMLGTNFDADSELPPKSGWMIRRPGGRLIADACEFLRPEDLAAEAGGEEPAAAEAEEPEGPWPRTLSFAGGDPGEAVAGEYRRTSEFQELLGSSRPVYVKAGSWGSPSLYVFYWQDAPDKPWKTGWWIAPSVGEDVNLSVAYNPDGQSELPPFSGWQVNHTNVHGQTQRRPHTGGFYHQPPEDLNKKSDRTLGLDEVVRKLDLQSLQDMVAFPDGNVQAYFGHQCALLHLEFLKELGQFRRRLTRRNPSELERSGLAMGGLSVRAVFGQRWKGRYGGLPGKASTGSEQVAFALAQRLDPDRCRFRRGESVLVSPAGCQNPLADRVGEAVINDLSEWEVVVTLEGHLPEDARAGRWRLDKAANHTAYERQLLALMKIAKPPQRWRQYGARGAASDGGEAVNSLLVSTPCGLIDEWADRMRERVDVMQAEKLQEKGFIEPEDNEEAWERWLNSDAGGAANEEAGQETPGQADMEAEADPEGFEASEGVAPLEGVVELATRGPPVDVERLREARKALSRTEDLNASQCRAVNAALCRRCTVVQGPPGTGKTHVSVRLLALFARELGLGPLLATSDSNVAVDNICQGLVSAGVKAIRLGHPEKVRSHLEASTLDAALKNRKDELRRSGVPAVVAPPPAKQPRRAEEPQAAPDPDGDLGWLKQVLGRAGAGVHFQGAAAWARETNCEECDFFSGEGVADLIEHLQLDDSLGEQLWEAVFSGERGEADGKMSGEAAAPEAAAPEAAAEAEEHASEAKAAPRVVPSMAEKRKAFGQSVEQDVVQRDQARRKRRYEDYELQMALLEDAEVICATTITAGSEFLSKFTFEVILVDEAAQATELSTIVPIVHRGTRRLVLVGDHCQLPPSIMSLEAETRGLSMSLYSRLVGNGLEPFFLNTQYRSHPKIAEFSAFEFYGGLLQSGVEAAQRPQPKGFDWPSQEVPVCFLDLEGRERRDGESRANDWEMQTVTQIVRDVLAAGELGVLDVGVVSPYQAQVRLLRRALREAVGPLLWQQRNWKRGAPSEQFDAKFLEVASVDSFQGREKEFIVFSAVRSNQHGNVGFLADWRRLNVMLTRARRGLVVVGHAATLRYDPFWQQFLSWCEDHGCIMQPWAEGEGEGDGAATAPATPAPWQRPGGQTGARPPSGAPPRRASAGPAAPRAQAGSSQGRPAPPGKGRGKR